MLTADFLDELARFDVATSHRTDDIFRGEQDSHATGEGLVYSDHREYVPGDETRRIDWNLYARTEELYITEYEEERNLTVHVLLDASESMGFGDGDALKFDYGAKLGLAYAYLFATENNDFRFSVFDSDIERLDRGRSTRGELLSLIDRCNDVTPDGQADFEHALAQYADYISSRSLVFVVSDFLADPAALEAGLAALADNTLSLAHLVAPTERQPPATAETRFRDPETGDTQRTYFSGNVAQSYRDRLDAHIDDVSAVGETFRATHTLVDTGRPFFDAFADVWTE